MDNLEQLITYWRKAADEAATKELALVVWGIATGLKMAKEELTNG